MEADSLLLCVCYFVIKSHIERMNEFKCFRQRERERKKFHLNHFIYFLGGEFHSISIQFEFFVVVIKEEERKKIIKKKRRKQLN